MGTALVSISELRVLLLRDVAQMVRQRFWKERLVSISELRVLLLRG